MKKRMLVLALTVAVLGGAVFISVISSSYRSPWHWHAVFAASVL